MITSHVHQVCPLSTGYIIRNCEAHDITISRGEVCRWDWIILGAVEGGTCQLLPHRREGVKLFFLLYINESSPDAATSGVEGRAGDGKGTENFKVRTLKYFSAFFYE